MLPASPLVTAAWLLENIEDPNLRVVDARFALGKPDAGAAAYKGGHVPGAIFVDLERDLSDPVREDRVGGRHPLPAPETLAARLSSLGIGSDDLVVVYDEPSSGQGFYAAHFWWLLRYLGHDAVRVLDGGLDAWITAGGSLDLGTVTLEPAVLTVKPRPEMLASATAVLERGTNAVLVDSRAPERYRGDTEPLDWKAGHIPGAVNRNWADGLSAGQFRDETAQQERFADLADKEVIVYCGSGVSAGANMLALEVAGVKDAKLYAGSWSDWISDPERPVAIGEEQ
jgi:thiosulfate/3-mercaptopyruvate sulfurtransferase